MKSLYSFFLFFIFISTSLIGQEKLPKKEKKYDNTVKGQFEKLYEKSNNYQDFKVVNRVLFQGLKKNTLDSVNALKSTINNNVNLIAKQKNKIEELNQSLTILNTDLAKVNEEKDDITFLGIAFSKGGFKKLVWAIFIGLIALLAVFVYKLQKSLKDTKLSIANLKDLEDEYEDHRRRALEREQVVMRKLQDEINRGKK